jgi:hypothetical protein
VLFEGWTKVRDRRGGVWGMADELTLQPRPSYSKPFGGVEGKPDCGKRLSTNPTKKQHPKTSTGTDVFFFFLLGDYYISRVRADPAFGAIRSRTRTTHWWQPPASCRRAKRGSRSSLTTPSATYLCSVEWVWVPAGVSPRAWLRGCPCELIFFKHWSAAGARSLQ